MTRNRRRSAPANEDPTRLRGGAGRLTRFFATSSASPIASDGADNSALDWLETIFVTSPVALAICSDGEVIDRANESMAQFLGYPNAELLAGTRWGDHVGRADDDASHGPAPRGVDLVFRRADGAAVEGRVIASALRRADGQLMTLVQVLDVTIPTTPKRSVAAEVEHDPLTGLLNRQGLLDAVEHDLREHPSSSCCLLLVNIDRLNSINHAWGEVHGDRVVEVVARRLRLATRVDDVLCRLGGDQFAVLLRRPATPEDARAAAERLLALSRERIDVGGKVVITSVSIGISRSRPDSTVQTLLREADIAMLEAKGAGRNRYEVFDGALRDAVQSRSRLEGELRLALSEGLLELHYQPEVDLLTGEILALEALVRWPHPDEGLLSAEAFVPLAEHTGMVTELGSWVLRTACEQLARWSLLAGDLEMRVNLSAVQLGRPDLVREVASMLTATGVDARRLCLELTETAVMDDTERSIEVLGQLASLGIRIAIDDFGTGFSSLAHLHRLPADVLKIDRSFVASLHAQEGTAIVRAVLGLADALGLDVVAEGVETSEQRDLLLSLGCRRAQGHFFSGALDERGAEAALRQ